MKQNKILFDKSALLFVAEALGFLVINGELFKNKFILNNGDRIKIEDVVGFQENKVFVKKLNGLIKEVSY